MRKINSILGPAMIILLLIHGITGAFQLFSIMPGGSSVREILSWVLVGVTGLHMIIGLILTVQTLSACRKGGKSYFRDNLEFWIRRFSGLAIILLVIYHICVFALSSGEYFRLNNFGWLQLAAHILLVLALAVHLVMNIKPLFMAFGIANRKYIKDIMIILSVVLLVCAAAFVFYYLRWNVLWRYGG